MPVFFPFDPFVLCAAANSYWLKSDIGAQQRKRGCLSFRKKS